MIDAQSPPRGFTRQTGAIRIVVLVFLFLALLLAGLRVVYQILTLLLTG